MSPVLARLKGPRLKLAGTYLIIIMVMSIGFSFAIYRISDTELRGQRNIAIPREVRFSFLDDFDRLRAEKLEAARENLRERLIAFNLITLVIGGLLSYILAYQALRPIEEVIEAQDRFASDASHEIRTPLTVMKSEIEVALRDNNLTLKEARQTLKSNLEEIVKLEQLTTGLLQLARQENVESIFEKISARQIIDEALDKNQPKISRKKITIDQKKVSDFSFRSEPQSLTQVLVILIDNAAKYSPPKSTIRLETKASRHAYRFSVIDQGPGIPAEDMPHIFDRFYRSDKSRGKDKESDGYGLGLAIAKQITDSLGGHIEVRSRLGHGTTFYVELPRR